MISIPPKSSRLFHRVASLFGDGEFFTASILSVSYFEREDAQDNRIVERDLILLGRCYLQLTSRGLRAFLSDPGLPEWPVNTMS